MSLKIYFCGSIRGGRQDVGLYAKIIKTLGSYGQVLTEHVGNTSQNLDKINENLDDKGIHDRDVAWLKQCDAVVAEVTQPSMGVGYELGRALAMGKKILCLFRPTSGNWLSAMVQGAHNGKSFSVKHYQEEEYPRILKEFFETSSKDDADDDAVVAKKRKTEDTDSELKGTEEESLSTERKVYFCGSIRGGRQDAVHYAKIVGEIKDKYGPVLTEHVAKEDTKLLKDGKRMSDEQIHEVDMKWLQSSTELVAEVTQVSMGVGYEIGRAVEMGKRILCLFRPGTDKRISAMIGGAHDGASFVVEHYKEEEYVDILREFFSKK